MLRFLRQTERACSLFTVHCSLLFGSVGPFRWIIYHREKLQQQNRFCLQFPVCTLRVTLSRPAAPNIENGEKYRKCLSCLLFWSGKMLETCSTFSKNIFPSAVWLVTPMKYFCVSIEFSVFNISCQDHRYFAYQSHVENSSHFVAFNSIWKNVKNGLRIIYAC